ncbi:MAG: sugar ABC transporter substrate-binding protein [Candidatus Dormiibacterota bacterium]
MDGSNEVGRRLLDRRQFLVGAASLASVAGLAACGTSLNGGGSSNGGSSGGGGGKVTLTQYYHEYGEAGTEQAVHRYAQQYMKQNPNVTVNIQWVPGDYATKLNTAIAGPNPPDVFETSPTVQMVQQKQIAPLDDIFTAADKADMYSNVLANNTINGHIYGAKIVTDVGLLYYRKSMLKQAGVSPPTTTDELVSAAKKLTQGKVKGLFLGDDGGVAALYELLPQANGVQLIQNNKIAFATQAAAQALQVLVQLNQQNSLLLGYQPDYLEPDAFINGLCAMQWTGLWVMPAVKKALGDDFGVIPLPAVSSAGKPTTFLGGWSECVSGKSKNLAAAKKYVQWLWITNKAGQKDFNLSYGFHLPPRKSIADTATALKSGPAKQAVDILNKYAVYAPVTWDNTINTYYTNAVSAIVQKRLSVAASMSQLQSAQQQSQSELTQELNG